MSTSETSDDAEFTAALVATVMTLLDQHPDGLLPIVEAGHPVLRTGTVRYRGQLGGDLFARLVAAMRTTMLAAPGVGLAAPQVGLPLAVAVVHDPGTSPVDPRERAPLAHRTLVNPGYEAVAAPGESEPQRRSFFEGCLSVPGYQAVVARHHAVRLTGEDEHGTALDEVLVGWPARIVQHETDHLYGRLYLDVAEPRSLATYDNLRRYWAVDAVPARAGEALGFPVAHA